MTQYIGSNKSQKIICNLSNKSILKSNKGFDLNQEIHKLQTYFFDITEKYSKTICKRYSKINIKDMLYYMTQLINDFRQTSLTVSSTMKCDKLTTASSSAFKKKRNVIPINFFSEIAYNISFYLNSITQKSNLLFNKFRLVGVDGTHSQVSYLLSEIENYTPVKNGTYVNCTINGLFDISNNSVIDLHLQKQGERVAFLEQLHLCDPNDIMIFDAGYFSAELYYAICNHGSNVIFRMPFTSSNVKQFVANSKQKDIICTIYDKHKCYKPIKIRLIKYTIGTTIYVLGTSLFDQRFTINVLKYCYHKRWDIEIYFRTIKYNLSFKEFHSKSSFLIKQEIYTHMIITILTRIFEELYKKHVKIILNNKKINTKNNIHLVNNKILILLLYDHINYKKEIVLILDTMFESFVQIVTGRSVPVTTIRPPNKHYNNAIRKRKKTRNVRKKKQIAKQNDRIK